jgi:hypothetical protein
MHTCAHCKLQLSESMFFKNAGRKSGVSILCKPCFSVYESSPDRRAKRTWNTINARSGRQISYKHVSVSMTREEFLMWAIPEYTKWMAENPGETPSLDRKDPSQDYCIENIRVLERGENNRLAKTNKNVHAPFGMAWCHGCKAYLPSGTFWGSSGSYNGLQHRCKTCQTLAIKKSRDSRALQLQATRLP